MKKIGTFLTFTLLLLLSTISFGQEQAEQPVYKDGEFWQFRVTRKGYQISDTSRTDGDYEVRFVGGDRKVYELTTAGQKVDATGDSVDALKRLTGHQDERQRLEFPLLVGKRWKNDYRNISGRNTISHNVETSVVGAEDVTTPAGVFRAFKIERLDIARASRGKNTSWYSPQTRSIVKAINETEGGAQPGAKVETELIKFGLALQ